MYEGRELTVEQNRNFSYDLQLANIRLHLGPQIRWVSLQREPGLSQKDIA